MTGTFSKQIRAEHASAHGTGPEVRDEYDSCYSRLEASRVRAGGSQIRTMTGK